MWLLCVLKDKNKLNDIMKLVGDSMFKNYKYKVEDCKEVEVYRDDIIEHLYTKVHRASNLFARHTMWNKDSQLILDFDHDLGLGKTGYDVAKYIIENDIAIEGFKVHSMNPVGVSNIRQLLTHYNRKEIN